jgi:hypothetical protein
MSRLLFTLAMFSLLVGLGALAVAARPSDGTPIAAQQEAQPQMAVAAAPEANTLSAPSAPAATNKYNFISIPLDSTPSVVPFTAAGLAGYVGGGVKKVVRFDAASQAFKTHTVGGIFNNFSLAVGGAYFIEVDSTVSTTLSFVGAVPEQESVTFGLAQGTSPTDCKYNAISIPLDRSDIANAAGLATAIGGVSKVTRWDASSQSFKTHTVGGAFNNFTVTIGMPFFVCVNSTGPVSWP